MISSGLYEILLGIFLTTLFFVWVEFFLITKDFDKNVNYCLKFVFFLRFALTSDVSLLLPDISSSQPVRYSRSHSTDSRRSRVMHQTVAFTDLDGSHPTTTLATTNASRAAAACSIGLVLVIC